MITPSTSSTFIDRRDPRAERPDGAIEHLDRELVAVLERARPDAARQARAVVLLHQLEQVGLAALLLVQLAHVRFHRRPPGIRLHAAAPPARAARAVDLDDHVPDLAGAAAPGPRLAVEDQPAAHAGPPEDARAASRTAAPRPSLNSASVATCTSLPTATRAAERACERRAPSGNVPSQPGRLRALVTLPSSIVPGEPTPTPGQRRRLDLRAPGRVPQRRLHLRRHVRRAALRRRRRAARSRARCHPRRRSPPGSWSRRGRSRRSVAIARMIAERRDAARRGDAGIKKDGRALREFSPACRPFFAPSYGLRADYLQ